MTGTSRFVAYMILVLTSLVGGVSLLLFMVFLFTGSFSFVDLRLGEPALLTWDTWLCFAFFVQHSGMIRKSFRHKLLRIIPSHYQGAVYTVASGAALLILLGLWQESAHNLVNLQGAFRWFFRGLFFISMAGFAWGIYALRSFDAFGLNPILAHVRGTQDAPMPLAIRGPYRWIRHPLYFFMLVIIWSCPKLSADRLLFNVFWTAWVVFATVLEERDLVTDFGDVYRNYQRKVPMLIPWRFPRARVQGR